MKADKKTPENVPTIDELIAQFSKDGDGGFPYPEIPEGASDEQVATINRVRGAVRRKAQGALVDFVIANQNEIELNPHQSKALAFLTAEHSRGRKGTGEGRGRVSVEEKVYDYFLNTDNHVASDGATKTPGEVGAVNVFIQLEMDPKRVLGTAKRILDSREPDDRLWINYNSARKVYTVAGPQAEAPEGWTGPLPTPKSAADLDGV